MKKIIVMLFAVAMVSSAYAMPPRGGFHGGGFAPRPHTTVIIRGGYSPFYSPYGYYGYPYYGYGYPFATVPSRPTKLDLQIQDIKNDYSDRIQSVKSDPDLSRQERREKVKEFKAERNDAIRNAKVNYYKS
jgi:hypothetical protein